MQYEGRAELGDHDDRVTEVVLRIPDVEQAQRFARIVDGPELPRGEVTITLLDGEEYHDWQGAAIVREAEGIALVLGFESLRPPIDV